MGRGSLRATLAAALAGACAGASAQGTGSVTIAVPSSLEADTATLQVTARSLPRGARLIVSTEGGEILGAVTPFGPSGDAASTYAMPVPASAIASGRLPLRLQVISPGAAPRAPLEGEVGELVVLPR